MINSELQLQKVNRWKSHRVSRDYPSKIWWNMSGIRGSLRRNDARWSADIIYLVWRISQFRNSVPHTV